MATITLTDDQKQLIHSTLYDYCHTRIPVQELTHAANEICKNPTVETCNEMINYLDQFDKEFVPLQTVDTKAIGKNEVRYGMAEIQKMIEKAIADADNKDDEEEADN